MIWGRNDHIDKQVLTKKKQGKRVWQRDLSNDLFVSLSEAGVHWGDLMYAKTQRLN
jgi:hypothetical protein